MIRPIPLTKLVPSPRNVRTTTDSQADLELKADIEAHGLLQNLIVTGVRKPRGSFAVEAGERRRRALAGLAAEGKLPPDHEVFCLVIEDADAAQEVSLAENFQRLRMNPADECLAFQQLVRQGADPEAIARRFGLATRFVEGRLRLAELAPIVFEALGSGKISLEVAKAFAATPDRERQAYVFEQMCRGYGAPHPGSVRRMMTQATISAADRRARFVGEDAYLAAGGRIELDLFDEDASARWLDVALLERLASEKMEELAAKAAAEQGLSFVRPTLDSWLNHSHLEGLRPLPAHVPALTEDETARVDALEAELEGLAELLDDETVDGNVRAEAEIKAQEADDAIRAIVDKSPVLDPSLRSQAGLFLMLDELGRARLDTTYYTAILPDADPLGGDGHPSRPEPASGSSAAAGLSQRLVNELAIQRRDILAVHLAGDPALALDLAIFLMVDRGTGAVTERSGFSLSASPPSNPILDFKTPEAAATSARAEADRALDRGWLDGETKSARFDAFRALSDEARAAWLGHAVAATIEASLQLPGDRFCSFHDHLGELLAIDVARWWRPTGANFFDRVPKSVTLAALAEVGGPALAARYIKARKPELAQACERIFSGGFIAELEVKEAALAWLPEVMRFGTNGLSGPDQPSEAGAQTTGTQPLPEPSPLGTPAPAELEVAA